MSKPTFHCALLLAAVVLTPLTAFAFWPQPVGAQSVMKQSSAPVYQQRERVLTVTGVGIESIPTTLTQVTLGVVVEAATAEEAQQQAAQRHGSQQICCCHRLNIAQGIVLKRPEFFDGGVVD